MKNFKRILCFYLAIILITPVLPAKKNETKIPDFSMTKRNDVPDKYKWKIEDIFASIDEWKKEKKNVFSLLTQFDVFAKSWTESPRKMLAFFELLNNFRLKGLKLFAYASHRSNMDMSNPTFQKMKGEIRNLFVKFSAKTAFMNNDILKLGKEKFTVYVKTEPGLKVYAFNVEDVLRTKDHVLPTDQQKIVSLTGTFSGAPSRASRMLNDMEMPAPEITLSDGTNVVLNYANYVRYRSINSPKDRSLVMRTFWKNHKKFENTLSLLLDAEMKKHVFYANVYNYQNTLQAKLDPNNIDPKVYTNLIKSVRENLTPLHNYLILKRKMLKLDKFRYDDIYASAVSTVRKKYSYSEAKTIMLTMLKPLGDEYVKGLQKAFDERWIDIYPNKGKQTGAYSGGLYGIHPYIKMNYNGSYSTLSTLAHELGHALHSYFSNKTQHFANARYASFLAEIASTFNENVLMEHLLKTEKDDLFKLFILDGYLERVRSTIYRQTMFAEFELAMHQQAESGKTLTPQWLDKTYLELTRFYYGHDKGVVQVDDYIENEWSSIPHFYLNYYVYTYSTGIIASMALTDMVLHGDKKNRDNYIKFLSSGGSKYPLDTLKIAGVDMTTAEPTKAALKQFERLVREMEKIYNRIKTNKNN